MIDHFGSWVLAVGEPKVDLYTLLTVDFAAKRFGDYFYEVKPQYARPDRSAYTARAGYLMTDLNIGASFLLHPRVRLSLSGSMEYLDGSVNQSSPLFRSTVNTSVSLVLIWVFAQSETKVKQED